MTVNRNYTIGVLSNPKDKYIGLQLAIWKALEFADDGLSVHLGIDIELDGVASILNILASLSSLGIAIRFHKWKAISNSFISGFQKFGYSIEPNVNVLLPDDMGIGYRDLEELIFFSSDNLCTPFHFNANLLSVEETVLDEILAKRNRMLSLDIENRYNIHRRFLDVLSSGIPTLSCHCLDPNGHQEYLKFNFDKSIKNQACWGS